MIKIDWSYKMINYNKFNKIESFKKIKILNYRIIMIKN